MNKDLMKMGILSLVVVAVITGCDEKKQRYPLIECVSKTATTPDREDNLIGTVIATKTYPNSIGDHGAKRLSHSLFFIDTDGDTKTAEYIGAIYYPDDNYIQGAGQAFNAERTGMKKTIAQWRQTLSYFQKIQKEKE
jgi:hypothetical protein